MNPAFSKHDVAFHEAGHAVCQRLFDETTIKVELRLQDNGEWWGGTHREPGKKFQLRTNFGFGGGKVELPDVTPLVRECVIAAAGCIAQALKAAREKQPNANLSLDQNWTGLHGWLSDETLVTEKAPLTLVAVYGDTPGEISIPPHSFSSGDQSVYCNAVNTLAKGYPPEVTSQFQKQLSSELHRFIGFQNGPVTWEVMCQIADNLTKQEANPSVVEGQELSEMLGKLTSD